ncbi:hypothetical protein WN943_011585 [Citrus x changshan-huyou]
MLKRRHPLSFGPLTEEDLELRLGPRTVDSSHIAFQGRSINGIEDVPKVSNDKEKCRVCESRNGAVVVGEVRFTCGICLDTMKEESSTKCGHVFCKSCIVDAIRLQGKCPTCRTRMSVRSIRRIFFPQLQPPASS